MIKHAPITMILLAAILLCYGLQAWLDPLVLIHFALWPLAIVPEIGESLFQPWQLVSYGFLHGGLLHLTFNSIALFSFGPILERFLGGRHYLLYYLIGLLGAAGLQLLVQAYGEPARIMPTIGASGAVFALLFAFAWLFPHEKLILLFFPYPIKAWIAVALYGGLELYLGIFHRNTGIAHFAHLGGMVAGYALLQYWLWRGILVRPRRLRD